MAALRTLEDGFYAGAAQIAARTGSPPNYLGKLLQRLSLAGIVESRKGKTGGFRLARAAREITLFDVLEPLEGVSRIERCILGSPRCTGACALHGRWMRIRAAYLRFLHETRLSAVIAAQSGDAVKEVSHE
jgi:Rrf2 family protein